MASRYDNRDIVINDEEQYETTFKDRDVNFIRQYTTPKLKYPTAEEISQLNLIGHIWAIGDRFYKLAYQFYGDSELWWIIAQYNRLATESHISVGDTIYVPLPLNKILKFLGY